MRYWLKKGFTLIELLIVIAIISILAGVLFVSIGQAPLQRSRDAKRVADMNEIQKALGLYLNDNKDLPDETYSADGSLAGWEVSFLSNFMEYLAPYIPAKIRDPINSGPPTSMFNVRPDGTFFYNYYYYNFPNAGTNYGCPWTGSFAVLGFRSVEIMDKSTLPKAQCGPQPCAGGGTPGVCRDWSTEFDYSVFILP